MKRNVAKVRIEKLKKEISFHRSQYHTHDKETISQAALDQLKHELVLLEQEFPDLIMLTKKCFRTVFVFRCILLLRYFNFKMWLAGNAGCQ